MERKSAVTLVWAHNLLKIIKYRYKDSIVKIIITLYIKAIDTLNEEFFFVRLKITIFWHIRCVPYILCTIVCAYTIYCGDRCTGISNILYCVPCAQCEKYGQCLSNGIYDAIITDMGMTIFFLNFCI